MPGTHHDLREEIKVLLGAARELSPEMDGFLAERFVSRLEQRNPLKRRRHQRSTDRRHPRRVVSSLLIAFATLATGAGLLLRSSDTGRVASCRVIMTQTYPSRQAALSDRRHLGQSGYVRTGGGRFDNGTWTVTYQYSGAHC